MSIGYTRLVPATKARITLSGTRTLAVSHLGIHTKCGSFQHSIDRSTKGLGAVKLSVSKLLSKEDAYYPTISCQIQWLAITLHATISASIEHCSVSVGWTNRYRAW